MRRASFKGIASGGGHNEPLIVVEESEGIAEEEEEEAKSPTSIETTTINHYLLTPWRDTRKRSLPTPACTSGITASQVRRLSEAGGESCGSFPVEPAFLATLCQAPTPMPGTRRHSVVTISKAPHLPPLFGRNRRESIAAFSSGLPNLPFRRDSVLNRPRGSLTSVNSSGSSFNLHLDIMDDITEAKARAKEKRKMSRTQSKDLTEEIEVSGIANLSMSNTSEKLSSSQNKPTDSDFLSPEGKSSKSPSPGIVCTNTDLISILSPLTSSAQEISGAVEEKEVSTISKNPNTGSPTQQKNLLDRKRKLFKDRSNSFDIGTLPLGASSGPASWFIKRHQPISKKDEIEKEKSQILVTFTDTGKSKVQTSLVSKPEKSKFVKTIDTKKASSPIADKNSRVVWDNRSGSVVDPQVFGSAIEEFLNQKTSFHEPGSPMTQAPAPVKDLQPVSTSSLSKNWFVANKTDPAVGESSSETCDNSICSTLKDLFVK